MTEPRPLPRRRHGDPSVPVKIAVLVLLVAMAWIALGLLFVACRAVWRMV